MGTYRIYIGGYLNGGFIIINMIMKYQNILQSIKENKLKGFMTMDINEYLIC